MDGAALGPEVERLLAQVLGDHGLDAVQAEILLPDEVDSERFALTLADRKLQIRRQWHHLAPARQVRSVLLELLAEHRRTRPHALGPVAPLIIATGRRLSVPEGQLEDLMMAAELQDIGKIGLPDAILSKEQPLTEQEWAIIRRHPIVAERVVAAAPALASTARAIRSSCERFDGTGYPDGLAGRDIPLGSRIIAVCVAFAAMTSERPYRPALTEQQAIAELRAASGTQFDPAVVGAFLAEMA